MLVFQGASPFGDGVERRRFDSVGWFDMMISVFLVYELGRVAPIFKLLRVVDR